MAKSAIHGAKPATASADPRIRLGKISPGMIHMIAPS